MFPYQILISSIVIAFIINDTSQFFLPENIEGNCRKYWWRNLLLIQNLFPMSELCMTWSWFVAADFQLFMLSTILLAISVK